MKPDNNLSSTTNKSEQKSLQSNIDYTKYWFAEHPDRTSCNLSGWYVRRSHIEEDVTNAFNTEAILQKHIVEKEIPPLTDLKGWQSIFRMVYHSLNGNAPDNFAGSCVEMHESTEVFRRFAGSDINKNVTLYGAEQYGGGMLLEHFRYKFVDGDNCDYVLNVCPELFYYKEPAIGYIKVFPFLGGVLLNSMQVFPGAREKGHGTRFLNMILDRAKKTQTKVYLLPAVLETSNTSLTQDELRLWYARHGFVNTLPICVPVLRLSHYKGGLTHIIRTKYMCFAPSLADAPTLFDDAVAVAPTGQTQATNTQTIHIAKNT